MSTIYVVMCREEDDLLDGFAAYAMMGFLSADYVFDIGQDDLADSAYNQAGAMLRARHRYLNSKKD